MIKRIVLVVLSLLLISASAKNNTMTVDVTPTGEYDSGSTISVNGRVLYGKGNPECRQNFSFHDLDVDNLISTKKEWDAFIKEHKFFVLAITDFACGRCCKAEHILGKLEKAIEKKSILSYPYKNPSKKKIFRKEIKLARMNTENKWLIHSLNEQGANIGKEDQIIVVKDGEMHKYDGNWHNVIVLMHFM